MSDAKEPDPYAELDVPRDATKSQIRKAWRKRAKSVHPDAGGDADACVRANRAAHILLDNARREEFDRTGEVGDRNAMADARAAKEIVQKYLGEIILEYVKNFDPAIDPRRANVVEVVAALIKRDIRAGESAAHNGRKHLDFLRDFVPRLRPKDQAEPIGGALVASLEHQIDQVDGMLQNVEDSIRLHKLALALIRGFDFRTDQPRPAEPGILLYGYRSN